MVVNELSSVLIGCLVQLCTVKDKGEGENKESNCPYEAEALPNLGKKYGSLGFRTRNFRSTKWTRTSIMDAPDVIMLLRSRAARKTLKILRSIEHALSLVAAER
jgi:hypothetical protein